MLLIHELYLCDMISYAWLQFLYQCLAFYLYNEWW